MPNSEYLRLSLSDEGWCCHRCHKEAFPFHDCSSVSTESESSLLSYSTSADPPQLSAGQCLVYYSNCRSLFPKIDHLRATAVSATPSIIALCETWLDQTIPDSALFIPNFHLIRRDRNRHGGGLALYVSDDIPSTCICQHLSLELLIVELKFKQGPLTLALYYRPPSSASDFVDLEDAILSLSPSQLKSCLLLGDFNVDLSNKSQLSIDLTGMLSSFHFTQLVNEPTRITRNCSTTIDHVYLTNPSLLSSCSICPPLASSDHRSIQLSLNWVKCPPKRVTRRIWNYSRANWDTICAYLDALPSPTDDVDSSWVSWKTHLFRVLSSHIPTKVCRVKKSLPWLSSDIFKLFRKRDIAFSQYKVTKSNFYLSKYRLLRNKSIAGLRKAKFEFFKSLASLIHSPKQFWSLYHSLTPNRQRIPPTLNDSTITVESAISKANLLASHFSACLSQSSHGRDCHCSSSPSLDCVPSKTGLSSITCTPDEVYKLLISVKVKTASGPDGTSSYMLRNTARAISPTLTELFNVSLSSGTVPSEWKLSNITPVFKGKGDPRCVMNYRPISLLPLPSKILERIIHNHLLNHLLSNNFLSPRQFGFRPGSSTQEALLFATHDWSCHLDKGSSVAAVFFDLSKAFDKVPHCQLLSALANAGVSGSLLHWFRSYLFNRFQRVVLDSHISEVHSVSSGVPQGSILGPLLFSTYVNSLTKTSISQDSTLLLYADDIVLFRPIISSCDVDALQSDINIVAEWISDAGLCLNANKSKVVVFSRKRVRPAVVVTVDSTVIPTVDSICFLGVTVTSDLKWNTHITNTCAKARQQLGIINRSFNQANASTLFHLYRCLVLPTLDYCSSVWDPHTGLHINKLESVQRLAARIITKCWSNPQSRTHPIHSLNLCSLQDRRWRQKAMICGRILKGCSVIPPTYFTHHPHLSLRLHHSYPLVTPFAKTAAHQSSFFISSTRIWNSLPDHVVCAPSGSSFKNRLKTLSIFNFL